MQTTSADDIRTAVRANYGRIATQELIGGCCGGGTSCGTGSSPSRALGYSEAELANVPSGADLGLGCGNPQAIAELKPGERVLDLGSGAGFDAFLAARQVGPTGRVIGVDMTPEMIAKARANARKIHADNVDFRLGEIERLPVADDSIDVIMSNCVINLSPDKPSVFREAYRVLAPGGRVAITDVVALRPIPPELLADMAAYTGCVSGAALAEDVERMLREAGFSDMSVSIRAESGEFVKEWLPHLRADQYIASALIQATKA
jgi:SAM-dependent methyltransferase